MARIQQEKLEAWNKRGRDLEVKERELRAAMNPKVDSIMKDKRLMLSKEILEGVHFPKADDLSCTMARGFDLVGDVEAT